MIIMIAIILIMLFICFGGGSWWQFIHHIGENDKIAYRVSKQWVSKTGISYYPQWKSILGKWHYLHDDSFASACTLHYATKEAAYNCINERVNPKKLPPNEIV